MTAVQLGLPDLPILLEEAMSHEWRARGIGVGEDDA